MSRPTSPAAARLLLVLAVLLLAACGGGAGEGSDAPNPVLAGQGDVDRGAELYAANCAACHGPDAGGTDQGPPFLDQVYVPSHHDDGAFLVAVRQGVQPHHWSFGPMPPIQGLDDQDVADIVAWVRAQQREAGIIE